MIVVSVTGDVVTSVTTVLGIVSILITLLASSTEQTCVTRPAWRSVRHLEDGADSQVPAPTLHKAGLGIRGLTLTVSWLDVYLEIYLSLHFFVNKFTLAYWKMEL